MCFVWDIVNVFKFEDIMFKRLNTNFYSLNDWYIRRNNYSGYWYVYTEAHISGWIGENFVEFPDAINFAKKTDAQEYAWTGNEEEKEMWEITNDWNK